MAVAIQIKTFTARIAYLGRGKGRVKQRKADDSRERQRKAEKSRERQGKAEKSR